MNKFFKGLVAFKDGFKQEIRDNKENNINFLITDLEDQLDKARVNHILHLILSLLTFGIWIIVWVLQAISVASERSAIRDKLKELYQIRDEKIKKEAHNTVSTENNKTFATADELQKLLHLKEQGILTEEEFLAQKQRVLS